MTKSNAQIFTELTGGKWDEENCVTFLNAADILNKMKEFCGEERYKEFVNEYIGEISYDVEHNEIIYINEKYILTPSLLLEKAVEYLRKENENE